MKNNFRVRGEDFSTDFGQLKLAGTELPFARLQKDSFEKDATIFDKYDVRITIEAKAGHTNESYTEVLNAMKDAGLLYREDRRYTIKPDRDCIDILIEKEDMPIIAELNKTLEDSGFKFYSSENLPEYIQNRTIITPEDELDKTKEVKKVEASVKMAGQSFPDYLVVNEKDMEGTVSSDVIGRWDDYPNNQVFNKDGLYVGEWQLIIDKDGKPYIIVDDTDPMILEEAQKEINKGYEGVDLRSYASKGAGFMSTLKDKAKDLISPDYESNTDVEEKYLKPEFVQKQREMGLRSSVKTANEDRRYSTGELEVMPTISQGQADNLKIETEDTRVWLSRMTEEDGMPYNNAVMIEKLIDGNWVVVDQYSGDSVATKKADLSVPEKHQKKIALDTLKMSDAGAHIMGGMTKEEAREFLNTKCGWSEEQVSQYENTGTKASHVTTEVLQRKKAAYEEESDIGTILENHFNSEK